MPNDREEKWMLTLRCHLTLESQQVYLTDAEKAELEEQSDFRGWADGELVELTESEPPTFEERLNDYAKRYVGEEL